MLAALVASRPTWAQGQADLDTLVPDLREVFPDQFAAPYLAESGYRPVMVPLLETVVGDIRTTLWILLGAVGILLAVACVNVANLFLVRSEARTGELAVRYVLGAHRGGLAGAVLLESVLLGLAGGAAGLPLAPGWRCRRSCVRVRGICRASTRCRSTARCCSSRWPCRSRPGCSSACSRRGARAESERLRT